MSADRRGPRRILVTGVGGAPGFDLARSLLRLGCEVIATDCDPYAPGLLLPSVTPRVTAPAADEAYRADLLRACSEFHPHAIMSTVEQELPKLHSLRRPLADLGVTTWLPDARDIAACGDKAAFHTALSKHGVPTPRTVLPDGIDQLPDNRPLIVKPRHGQGAKNVVFCETREQARILCQLAPDPIVQEAVTGREFTADCLVDRSGRASVILRYRLLVKGGLAVVSRTFHDQEAEARVKQTLAAVGSAGACCAQGFLCDDGPERISMTEVNARVGGGFEAAIAAFLDTVAVASGTSALHVALLAAGIGPGDEVIVPSLTFCASIQAILATGARPRFADVNPRTLCVDNDNVLDALTPNTRAVMPVLYGGRAVDLTDAESQLADRGITVIEGAAHAFGSYEGNCRVGATGKLTCFTRPHQEPHLRPGRHDRPPNPGGSREVPTPARPRHRRIPSAQGRGDQLHRRRLRPARTDVLPQRGRRPRPTRPLHRS